MNALNGVFIVVGGPMVRFYNGVWVVGAGVGTLFLFGMDAGESGGEVTGVLVSSGGADSGAAAAAVGDIAG